MDIRSAYISKTTTQLRSRVLARPVVTIIASILLGLALMPSVADGKLLNSLARARVSPLFAASFSDNINTQIGISQLLMPMFPPATFLSNNLVTFPNMVPSIAATTGIPFLSVPGQNPLIIQGSASNGFVSYLCAGTGLQTPVFSLLSFQASSSSVFGTQAMIPSTGTLELYNSFGVPSIIGEINSGQITGSTFTLQGTLTTSNANTVSGIGGTCLTPQSSFTFPVSNSFTITGTCGANVPLAFVIDRSAIGTYTGNVACSTGVT